MHALDIGLKRLQAFGDRQCGAEPAVGMILVGDGRTEERHDSITEELIDGAFVPVDRLAAGSTAVAGGVAAASRTPHSWQNLFVGGLDAWHEGQTDWSRAPHSPQNLTLAAFSCRH